MPNGLTLFPEEHEPFKQFVFNHPSLSQLPEEERKLFAEQKANEAFPSTQAQPTTEPIDPFAEITDTGLAILREVPQSGARAAKAFGTLLETDAFKGLEQTLQTAADETLSPERAAEVSNIGTSILGTGLTFIAPALLSAGIAGAAGAGLAAAGATIKAASASEKAIRIANIAIRGGEFLGRNTGLIAESSTALLGALSEAGSVQEQLEQQPNVSQEELASKTRTAFAASLALQLGARQLGLTVFRGQGQRAGIPVGKISSRLEKVRQKVQGVFDKPGGRILAEGLGEGLIEEPGQLIVSEKLTKGTFPSAPNLAMSSVAGFAGGVFFGGMFSLPGLLTKGRSKGEFSTNQEVDAEDQASPATASQLEDALSSEGERLKLGDFDKGTATSVADLVQSHLEDIPADTVDSATFVDRVDEMAVAGLTDAISQGQNPELAFNTLRKWVTGNKSTVFDTNETSLMMSLLDPGTTAQDLQLSPQEALARFQDIAFTMDSPSAGTGKARKEHILAYFASDPIVQENFSPPEMPVTPQPNQALVSAAKDLSISPQQFPQIIEANRAQSDTQNTEALQSIKEARSEAITQAQTIKPDPTASVDTENPVFLSEEEKTAGIEPLPAGLRPVFRQPSFSPAPLDTPSFYGIDFHPGEEATGKMWTQPLGRGVTALMGARQGANQIFNIKFDKNLWPNRNEASEWLTTLVNQNPDFTAMPRFNKETALPLLSPITEEPDSGIKEQEKIPTPEREAILPEKKPPTPEEPTITPEKRERKAEPPRIKKGERAKIIPKELQEKAVEDLQKASERIIKKRASLPSLKREFSEARIKIKEASDKKKLPKNDPVLQALGSITKGLAQKGISDSDLASMQFPRLPDDINLLHATSPKAAMREYQNNFLESWGQGELFKIPTFSVAARISGPMSIWGDLSSVDWLSMLKREEAQLSSQFIRDLDETGQMTLRDFLSSFAVTTGIPIKDVPIKVSDALSALSVLQLMNNRTMPEFVKRATRQNLRNIVTSVPYVYAGAPDTVDSLDVTFEGNDKAYYEELYSNGLLMMNNAVDSLQEYERIASENGFANSPDISLDFKTFLKKPNSTFPLTTEIQESPELQMTLFPDTIRDTDYIRGHIPSTQSLLGLEAFLTKNARPDVSVTGVLSLLSPQTKKIAQDMKAFKTAGKDFAVSSASSWTDIIRTFSVGPPLTGQEGKAQILNTLSQIEKEGNTAVARHRYSKALIDAMVNGKKPTTENIVSSGNKEVLSMAHRHNLISDKILEKAKSVLSKKPKKISLDKIQFLNTRAPEVLSTFKKMVPQADEAAQALFMTNINKSNFDKAFEEAVFLPGEKAATRLAFDVIRQEYYTNPDTIERTRIEIDAHLHALELIKKGTKDAKEGIQYFSLLEREAFDNLQSLVLEYANRVGVDFAPTLGNSVGKVFSPSFIESYNEILLSIEPAAEARKAVAANTDISMGEVPSATVSGKNILLLYPGQRFTQDIYLNIFSSLYYTGAMPEVMSKIGKKNYLSILREFEDITKSIPRDVVSTTARRRLASAMAEGRITGPEYTFMEKAFRALPPETNFLFSAGFVKNMLGSPLGSFSYSENLVSVSDVKAISHELMHMMFQSVLDGSDRIQMMEHMFDDVIGKMEHALESTTSPLTAPSNYMSDANEYFSEQFNLFMTGEEYHPSLNRVMLKVANLSRDTMFDLAPNKFVNKNLADQFHKLIDDNVTGNRALGAMGINSGDMQNRLLRKLREVDKTWCKKRGKK